MMLAGLLAASLSAATPVEMTDAVFARWNTADSPGCSVGIVQDGKVVHQRGYGMANLEHGIANTPQTQFYLGSTSKEFTAMAILLLAEQGALKLEHPIRKWVPQLPAYMQSITVRHLLEHSSGIRDYIGLWTLSGPAEDGALNDAEVYGIITRQKELNFQPGEEFLYSNSGYYLLNLILRPAAYRQLQDFAKERIFAPLALSHTFYYKDRFAILPRRASGYSSDKQGQLRINSATLDVIGDGGVFTTVEDGIRWLRILESPPPAHAQAVAQMKIRATLNGGGMVEYGRGLMLKSHRGLDTWSHVGGLRGYRSEMLFIPSPKLGVVCLCNTSDADAGRLARQAADAWLGRVDEPVVPKLTAAELQRKAGDYRDKNSGDYLQLGVAQGRLLAMYQGFQLELRPVTETRFRAESPLYMEIEFEKDTPRFLRVEGEINKLAAFERVKLDRAAPRKIEEYLGDYVCEEAPSRLSIRLAEGMLTLEQNDQPIGSLEPMQPDRFRAATVNIEFRRDAQKQITGFRLNTGRVRGLLFQKRVNEPPRP
ncbi:MAG TPA: serine hydrolase [Bryobacteraceae bacterium]|nr:serine hydrolase [Bryobacteraceae bacterium]